MIPQRIALTGFLCYRDEQEIDLDGVSLWMLSGLNGSGKSAIFDAVTFALFGGHRGGKGDAHELIHKRCDRAGVEFDFTLDGRLYRVQRTLKRKTQGGAAGTQQVLRKADAGWVPEPDASSREGFNNWVRHNLGLTFETFTSSVLLMQGQAERLLAADPRERHAVLAGIVDLERFQALHEKADRNRKELDARVRAMQQQLQGVPEVSDAELEEAAGSIALAERELEQARADADRLQRLVIQAQRWAELESKQSELLQLAQQVQPFLSQADAIERDAARLSELAAVLPHLRTVVEQRARLAASAATAQVAAAEKQQWTGRLGQLRESQETSRRESEALKQAVAVDQGREQEVGVRLRELAALLGRIHLCEQQRRELKKIEDQLARLPPTLADEQGRQQTLLDELTELSQALPLLRRLFSEREALRRARQRLADAVVAAKAFQQKGDRLAEAAAAEGRKLETAAEARRLAEDRVTEARTLLHEATRQREQLEEMSGARTCRACGQPLTQEHLLLERSRRGAHLELAKAAFEQAEIARDQAVLAELEWQGRSQTVSKDFDQARRQAEEAARHQTEAQRDRHKHEQDCAWVWDGLPERFRQRIGPAPDWLATTYPTSADLAEAEGQLAGLEACGNRLKAIQADRLQFDRLQAQAVQVRQGLAAQEQSLAGDGESARQEHAALGAEEAALQARLAENRGRIEKIEAALERGNQELQHVERQLQEQQRALDREEVVRKTAEEALARASSSLSAGWEATAATAADLARWHGEQVALEKKDAAGRLVKLQQARLKEELLRQQQAELQAEQDALPPEARTEPEQVQKQMTAARQTQIAGEETLRQARQRHEQLQAHRDQRKLLEADHNRQDRELKLAERLTELLGRNRLQLHLVRQAERGIVAHANAVLDRLSAGQLGLRLRSDDGAAADRALQLEAYDRAADQTIGVAFLSGSQRFRVAVSLALGIGQYASRQHRPIESVIIDEGFGCLDRNGRQAMIQELQNLQGQLRCILLVSHQEEFADAFPDGYRFEMQDGTTRVMRLQR